MLSYNRAGSGVPLVFLHAFPLSQKMWDVNRPHLSRNFELITVDFPGFGQSPLPPEIKTGGVLSMEFMARQVAETLDHLQISEKIVLAGVSMGGYVAFRFLELFPERLRALVLLSTRSAPDTPPARESRFKNIDLVQKEGVKALAQKTVPALLGKSSLASRPTLVEEVRQQVESADPFGVCVALRGMAERPDSSSLLKGIQVPTLVVAGEEDTVIPSAEIKTMAEQISKSEFHVLPQAGHLLNLEQPDAFKDIFQHFLKRRVL
jgi:pimeloyl-ACP methyl ester carboxylesterase